MTAAGAPNKFDDAGLFAAAERAVIDYVKTASPFAVTLCEYGEWYAEIGGRRISLSAMALAVAQNLEGKR